jgi:hypothetical protein
MRNNLKTRSEQEAGGWRPGSRMPERYYGRHRVMQAHMKLTVREAGSDAPPQDE